MVDENVETKIPRLADTRVPVVRLDMHGDGNHLRRGTQFAGYGAVPVLTQYADAFRPGDRALLRVDLAGQDLHKGGLTRAVRTGKAIPAL